MKKIALFFLFFLFVQLYGTLTIYNDSPYPLSATITSADGKVLQTLQVMPQHQATWEASSNSNYTFSQTPYTVTFNCKSGRLFGVYSYANQGAYVTAMQSEGDRYCKPRGSGQSSSKQGSPQQELPPLEQHDLDLGPP